MLHKPPGPEGISPHDRSQRVPLFVPVVTQPAIHACWSVDISALGVGLHADHFLDELPLEEGDSLEVGLSLPGSGFTIRSRGVVVWRHGDSDRRGAALGVRFTHLPARDRGELARYLQDYRHHVAVVFAVSSERRRLEAQLGAQATLHFCSSVGALREKMGRGDLSAIIACGGERELLDAVVKTMAHGVLGTDLRRVPLPLDLAPRLISLGGAEAPYLLDLFNRGALFRALGPDPEESTLQSALREACANFGHETEKLRAVQSVERALHRELARATPNPSVQALSEGRVIHESRAMEEVMRLIRLVAPHRVGVLLHGETGTGKEVLARTLHDLSDRADAPFVVQDCGLLTETLLESELFGHVRGAFTGATHDHPGLFVLGDGGTVFLDEIENTSPNLQAKLLRVLEEGTLRPVGGTQSRSVDVRIIVATNQDLAKAVDEGRFRADLYFRLNTFIIDIPPLRERKADILPLARHFIRLGNAQLGGRAVGLSAEAEGALLGHSWPGNIRELRNTMERAVLLSSAGDGLIGAAELPREFSLARPAGHPGQTLQAVVDAAERAAISSALGRHEGVLRRAARELGVSAVTLGRKARRLGLLDPSTPPTP